MEYFTQTLSKGKIRMAGWLFLIALLNVSVSNAQVSKYGMTVLTGTYTPITGTTPVLANAQFSGNVNPGHWSDGEAGNVPIGFSFVFNGTTYTNCNVSANGAVSFGTTNVTQFGTPHPRMISQGAYGGSGVIAAFSRPLRGFMAASSVAYTTLGTAPNRIFVAQWTNAQRPVYSTNSNEDIDFQVRMYEGTNRITLNYGGWSDAVFMPTDDAGYGEVGLRGTSPADFLNLEVLDNGSWWAPSIGLTNTASCYYSPYVTTVKPTTGLVYIFYPPDVSVAGISVPTSDCPNTGTVQVTLKNTGGQTQIFSPANPATVTLQTTGAVTQTLTTTITSGSLNADGTVVATFNNVDFNTSGAYQINASMTLPSDQYSGNNTASASKTILPTTQWPYTNDFTTAPAFSNNTGWALGASGHGRTGNGWYTALNTAGAPYFTFDTMTFAAVPADSQLKFDYRIVNQLGYPSIATPATNATIVVTISTDCGTTYPTVILQIDTSNHVASTAWATKTIPLAAYAGQSVKFRFYAIHNQGDFYVDMDNFQVTGTQIPCAALTAPVNAATNIATNSATMTWNTVAAATSYDVYFGTSFPPPFAANTTSTQYMPYVSYIAPGLLPHTRYYWKIVAKNGAISSVGCENRYFDTSTYCTPVYFYGSFGTQNYIASVTLGNLTNTTADIGNTDYSYFPHYRFFDTVTKPVINRENQITVSVTLGTTGAEYAAAWIDFNRNGDFDPSEGVVSTTPAASGGTVNLTFNVPANAVLGDTRMRIRGGDANPLNTGDACTYKMADVTNGGSGQTEDYTVTIAAALPIVQCATLTYPANNATNIAASANAAVTVKWTAPATGPVPVSYDIYSGTTAANMTLKGNTASLTFTLPGLANNTKYFWKVIARAGSGAVDAFNCETRSFTTGSALWPYCSDFTISYTTPITLVNFAGINKATSATPNGTPAIENFTSISGNVSTYNTYPMTLKGNTDGDYQEIFMVYIDWNHDGDFDDANETMTAGSITNSTGTDAVQLLYNIAIPADALAGATRMRVKKYWAEWPQTSPCAAGPYGQAEDYTLNVTHTPVQCVTLASPANNTPNVNGNSGAVTLSWTPSAAPGPTVISYDVFAGTSVATMTLKGNTANTTFALTGINPGTTYYWKVVAKAVGEADATGCSVFSFTTFGGIAPYCDFINQQGYVWPITRVIFAGMDNQQVETQPYAGNQNFTQLATSPTILRGTSYQLAAQFDGNELGYIYAFFDWNQDGDFNDAFENYPNFSTYSYDESGHLNGLQLTINVPANALPGITRMRVKKSVSQNLDPCTGGGGQTEDYSVNVSALPVPLPDCISGTVPENAATDILRNATLSWQTAPITTSGDATSYDIYLGTSSNPPFVANVTGTSYTPGVLLANTVYYWKVVPKNAGGSAAGCITQTFTTSYTFQYCTSAPTGPSFYGIHHATVGSTTVTIYGLNYFFASAQAPEPMLPGQLVNANVSLVEGTNAQNVNIWIDLNDDGDFDDAGERVANGVTSSGGASLSFYLPLTASAGIRRLRIGTAIQAFGQALPGNPCYSGFSGGTIDMNVNILPLSTDAPDTFWLQDASITANAGAYVAFNAHVYEAGLTNGTGQGQGIQAWVAVNSADTDPATWSPALWKPATFNATNAADDLYSLTSLMNMPTGTYYYSARFRLNNGSFVYASPQSGAVTTFNGNTYNGKLTVSYLATQCATPTAPANGATNVILPGSLVTLAWNAPTAGYAPDSYNFYWGTTPQTMTLLGALQGTQTSIDLMLSYGQTYYWQVVPQSALGGVASGCQVSSFTTQPDPIPPYCSDVVYTAPSYFGAKFHITSVSFSGVQTFLSTPYTPIANYVHVTSNVAAGSTYPISITAGSNGYPDFYNGLGNFYSVFIDWNHDGDFSEDNEIYFLGYFADDADPGIGNINVPATALLGTTRMRIKVTNRNSVNVSGMLNPCTGGEWGHTADFSVNVTPCSNLWYADADADGYGNPNIQQTACTAPEGYVADHTDCNDNDFNQRQIYTYYVDSDGDTYGGASTAQVCGFSISVAPAGYSASNTDCNDNDATMHQTFPFYHDADGDSYGNPNEPTQNFCAANAFTPPAGYAANNTDCNDNDAAYYQMLSVYYDNDGDGYTVGSPASVCSGANAQPPYTQASLGEDCDDYNAQAYHIGMFYDDFDMDGYNDASSTETQEICYGSTTPTGYSPTTLGADCNDQIGTFHPGAPAPFTVTIDHPASLRCDGAPITLTAAVRSYAMDFDGVDDYVQLQDFALGTNNFTMEAWINPAAVNGGYIVSNRTNEIDSAGNWFAVSQAPDGKLKLEMAADNSAYAVYTGNTVIPTNAWTHIAITRVSSTTIKFYVNGVLDATFTDGIRNLSVPGQIAHIGGWGNFGASSFHGKIDQVHVWQSAFNQIGITQHLSTMILDGRFNLQDNLFVTAPSTTEVKNISRFAHNGTMMNGASATTLSTAPVSASGVSYTWSNGNAGASISVTDQGTYTVTANISDPGNIDQCTQPTASVTYGAPTLPIVKVSGSSPQNVCLGSPLTLNGLGADSYTWTGGVINGVPFYPTETATYIVTGTDANGCSNSASVTVNVAPAVTAYYDFDIDGYGGAGGEPIIICGDMLWYMSTNNLDCDDFNPTVHPGAAEIPNNGIDENCNGQIDEGSVPVITTAIQSAFCGQVLPFIDSQVVANIVPGAQGYRWHIITNSGPNAGQEQELDTALRVMKFTQLVNYAFGTQYKIEIAVRYGGIWQPFAASACLITTPSPTTQLVACGLALTSMTDVIYANMISYAAGYRFRITDPLNAADTQVIERSLREFRMSLITNFAVQYGKQYNVEVSVKNTDGTWLPYGAICNITTPIFPTTSLQESQCNNYMVAGNNTQIYAVSYPGAIAYVFQLSGAGLASPVEVTKMSRTFTLNDFAGQLIPGATYNVKVRLVFNANDAAGPFGKVCTITTPGLARQTLVNPDAIFNAVAYPNPFADGFNIDVTTASDKEIHIKVYDMTGRLLETEQRKAGSNIPPIGDRFPSGVYNVVVKQGDNVKTLRVIKR